MSGGGSRHVGAPRTLNVQQFANARGVEVQSLHTALKNKKTRDGSDAGFAIARCLRRRTTSHNRRKSFFWQRKAKKRKGETLDELPVTAIDAEGGGADVGREEVPVTAKRPPCRRVRRRIELRGDEKGGGGCSMDGTQRLVTHVWHAKRFTMTKIWGHWLAEGLPGRGRGSRAVVKWKNEAAVLHDASFYSAIELEGSAKSITDALQLVLEPAPPRSAELMSDKDQSVYSGAEYGRAMLHYRHSSPRGAISPITYIWRRESNAVEERRIWLWVHAGAFEEALACLQLLCQSQDIQEKGRLQCWSRKDQFGRLDLLGSKAMTVLQKVLHPVARSASQDGGVDAVSSRFLENNDQFSVGAIVEMEVWDPRCRPGSDTTFEPFPLLDAGSNKNGVEIMDPIGQKLKRPSTFNHLNVDSSDVWGRSGPTRQDSIVMPLSEKDLSIRRNKKRLSYIQLNDISEAIQEERTATIQNDKCSIMVLKHDHGGFSLLLPIGWVRAFWVPLVFAGGHVVGLRERHWLQTDAELPSFPHDYPDCTSYDQHMAQKSAEYQATYNRKPPSKRGLWKSEVLGWEFLHEASRLDSGKFILAPDVSRADSGAEISCGAVAAGSVTDASKTTSGSLAALLSAGPEAPSVQLNICSSAQHVQMAVSEVAVSAAIVTKNSAMDLSVPSSVAPASPSRRDPTSQTIASDPVLHEGLGFHNVVGLHGEPSPQPDPTSSSQPVAIANEGQEKGIDSSADLKELAEIKEHRVSQGGDTEESSMFVARTRDTLLKFLRDCSLHHLPLLREYSEKHPWSGHPASQLSDDGSMELLKKGCLVRVLVHAPRKGVFDEGAVIYLPLRSDVNSYCCSSPRWHGFEDRSFKQVQQSLSTSSQTEQPERGSQCRSLRVPIGITTSASVRGSTSIKAIGICEVAALGVLRATQLDDRRWPTDTSEIFLLVRNKCSPMYRPALASIVLETSDDIR